MWMTLDISSERTAISNYWCLLSVPTDDQAWKFSRGFSNQTNGCFQASHNYRIFQRLISVSEFMWSCFLFIFQALNSGASIWNSNCELTKNKARILCSNGQLAKKECSLRKSQVFTSFTSPSLSFLDGKTIAVSKRTHQLLISAVEVNLRLKWP